MTRRQQHRLINKIFALIRQEAPGLAPLELLDIFWQCQRMFPKTIVAMADDDAEKGSHHAPD